MSVGMVFSEKNVIRWLKFQTRSQDLTILVIIMLDAIGSCFAVESLEVFRFDGQASIAVGNRFQRLNRHVDRGASPHRL